jgi:hypothetical protein
MAIEKDTLSAINHRISSLEKTKAGSDLVKSELSHINKGLEEVKARLSQEHSCINFPLIENIETQVQDNAKSIRKLYVWHSSVGISLLIFFLTIGVAALRFVDSIDNDVQAGEVRIQNIEKDNEETQESNKELTAALLAFIKSNVDK